MSSVLIIGICTTLLIFIITALLFCLRFHYKRKRNRSTVVTNAVADMEDSLFFMLSLCFGFFLFASMAVFLTRGCRRKKPPAAFTSTITSTPGGYPVTVMPIPPGSYQATVHSAPPYPTQIPPTAHVAMPMPMPMPANQAPVPGFQTMPPYPQMAPYPPSVTVNTTGPSAGHLNMNPPTYDMAVGQPSTNLSYEKQLPYNPNFVSH